MERTPEQQARFDYANNFLKKRLTEEREKLNQQLKESEDRIKEIEEAMEEGLRHLRDTW